MKKVIVGAFIVFAMIGCAPHTAGVMVGSKGETRIDNKGFAKDVTLQSVITRAEGDMLEGSATIINQSSTDLRLQYKFSWYDTNDMSIDDEGVSWKSVKLHGKQRLQVSSVAPNTQATRFELYVREVFSH
ncbi:YcfL family protein [Shewanella sp.]|nr:YcfL family protein [Shewanella sp.]